MLNEAHVKARYSKHYQISEEALTWLMDRTDHLQSVVRAVCEERLEDLEQITSGEANGSIEMGVGRNGVVSRLAPLARDR